MASPVDPLRNCWQHLYQQMCAEADQNKLLELMSRLEDAILLRQTELPAGADHHDERIAMDAASKVLLGMKIQAQNLAEVVTATLSDRNDQPD